MPPPESFAGIAGLDEAFGIDIPAFRVRNGIGVPEVLLFGGRFFPGAGVFTECFPSFSRDFTTGVAFEGKVALLVEEYAQ